MKSIQTLGRATILIKMDLESAYRQVLVHPDDHPLLGISWNGQMYVDRTLPFCLRSAPSAVADMMAWALQQAGIEHLIHYLDDFLFLVPPTTADILALAQDPWVCRYQHIVW